RGMHALASYVLNRPHEAVFTAVAEIDEARRQQFSEMHNIPLEGQFASWRELLDAPDVADALIISTPDQFHFEPAMAGLRAGYPILLEKPMSPDPLETKLLAEEAERQNQLLMICHPLRYVPYF